MTKEIAYFISSKNTSVCKYQERIRLHWKIENSLHYVKDVTLKEDASKTITGNVTQNLSIIKKIFLLIS